MNENKHNPQHSLDRRRFLGTGAATAFAMTVGSANAAIDKAQKIPVSFNEKTFEAMPTRNLGKTGYRVGLFSLGCQAAIEKQGNEDISEAILNRSLDLGVNYFDTAPLYGNGISEINVGRVMKHRRNEVFLATKTHERTYDKSMKLLEQSLKRLHTDHIDCWQLHNVQKEPQFNAFFADDGAIKALVKAKEEGMTRFVGLTGHYEPQILIDAIERFDFDTILIAVNAADRHNHSFIDTVLPAAMEKNLGIIGMKVATRGRLLSTWAPPPLDQQPEHMATNIPGTITMKEAFYFNSTLPVSTNIIGVDNPKQVEKNVKWASEFTPLTEAQMAAIEKRTRPITNQALYFRKSIIDENSAVQLAIDQE